MSSGYNLKRSGFFIVVFLVTLTVPTTLNAKDYSIKGNVNIKTVYGNYPNLGYRMPSENDHSPVFQAEFNYGILDYLELGLYSGYTQIKTIIYTPVDNVENQSTIEIHSGIPIAFYGINSNIHILPFLLNHSKSRIDLYFSGKFGGFYRYSNEDMFPIRANNFDYGVYAGISFYFNDNWGVYSEFGKGNYVDNRFGISLRY